MEEETDAVKDKFRRFEEIRSPFFSFLEHGGDDALRVDLQVVSELI